MKIKRGLITAFSLICFILINIVPSKEILIISGAFIAASLLFAVISRRKINQYTEEALDFNNRDTLKLFSLITAGFFGMRFFILWQPSSALLSLCFGINFIKIALLAVLSLAFICGTYILLNNAFRWIQDVFNNCSPEKLPFLQNQKTGAKPMIVIALTTVIFVTLCSKSSPIYPFNDWVDANCFFTVGKAVANNVVLYKDIFEQKGPLLYFVHALAYLVSPVSFFGVYLLELVNGFLLLLILYKTMRLFTDSDVVIFIPALAVVIYSSKAFSMGGSAEEFCLPCLALCNYFGLKAVAQNKKLKISEWFLTGLTASFVLWYKFSLLGFYVGFGVFFAVVYLKNKWIKQAFASVAALAGGIAALSVPVMIYFVVNKAVKDLFEVYFYDNLFFYTVDDSENKLYALFNNMYCGMHSFLSAFVIGLAFIILGIIYFAGKNKKLYHFILCTFLFNVFFVYSGGRHYVYYPFIMAHYIPFGFVPVYFAYKKYIPALLDKAKRKKAMTAAAGILYSVICIAAAFILSSNTFMLRYTKEDLPQYKFAEIMSQTENPTLLEYKHLDSGFYTAANIVPTCKYFCGLNIDYDVLDDTQDEYIANGVTDYVVVRKDQLTGSQLDVYELISTQTLETEKNLTEVFYLYKRR